MFKRSFLKKIATKEEVNLSLLVKGIKKRTIIVPCNNKRKIENIPAIGKGLRVKINTNIGTSSDETQIIDELKKLNVAIRLGTDTVMDLSTGGDLKKIRRKIVSHSAIPVGSVPIYEAAKYAEERKGSFDRMTIDDILEVIKEQAEDGIDFFTIHAGITKNIIRELWENKRAGGIVSRGGAILARWMLVNKRENPLFEYFDKILDIVKKYNITVSLGDALRPGTIADSTDRFQLAELFILSELVKKCFRKDVQVMVEGPGHIKLDEIETNVRLAKRICYGVPFYILGPLTTDIAAGYDHIASAIGGAIAAYAGADFLCVVTPAEHLRHPSQEDIREGVIASKIAAHSVDLLRFHKEWERDYKLSLLRKNRNWEDLFPLTLDPEKAKGYHYSLPATTLDVCTMCSKFCSLKIIDECGLL